MIDCIVCYRQMRKDQFVLQNETVSSDNIN